MEIWSSIVPPRLLVDLSGNKDDEPKWTEMDWIEGLARKRALFSIAWAGIDLSFRLNCLEACQDAYKDQGVLQNEWQLELSVISIAVVWEAMQLDSYSTENEGKAQAQILGIYQMQLYSYVIQF